MALETVTAVQTPLPLPDMSSPNNSFENFSFIISSSANISSRLKRKSTQVIICLYCILQLAQLISHTSVHISSTLSNFSTVFKKIVIGARVQNKSIKDLQIAKFEQAKTKIGFLDLA